jgi:hypothetical protein
MKYSSKRIFHRSISRGQGRELWNISPPNRNVQLLQRDKCFIFQASKMLTVHSREHKNANTAHTEAPINSIHWGGPPATDQVSRAFPPWKPFTSFEWETRLMEHEMRGTRVVTYVTHLVGCNSFVKTGSISKIDHLEWLSDKSRKIRRASWTAFPNSRTWNLHHLLTDWHNAIDTFHGADPYHSESSNNKVRPRLDGQNICNKTTNHFHLFRRGGLSREISHRTGDDQPILVSSISLKRCQNLLFRWPFCACRPE